MLLALPGRIWAVVTPPPMARAKASSWVLSASMLRSQGRIGALWELWSFAPFDRNTPTVSN